MNGGNSRAEALNDRQLDAARTERDQRPSDSAVDTGRLPLTFQGIVAESAALKEVLRRVEIVAATDSTVLIQGETGTGKELIAHAIHNLSLRRDRPFITLNCAAIPLGLLESELFGHEKGAFTGAVTQRPGRFELAHQGTLFLDEIGDIRLELQAKLLRVLQEQEFERLGGTRTIRTDVRVISATNRDLAQMVEKQQFRIDLYYRLDVFPVVLPPLRERREDIPRLVEHFVAQYAERMNKRIDTIPAELMERMKEYSWPGNVRELQNFVERAVILSSARVLSAPLAELRPHPNGTGSVRATTLEEAEREHILRMLEETNWMIGGPQGAAARLGLPRTTLIYRMRKLGIPGLRDRWRGAASVNERPSRARMAGHRSLTLAAPTGSVREPARRSLPSASQLERLPSKVVVLPLSSSSANLSSVETVDGGGHLLPASLELPGSLRGTRTSAEKIRLAVLPFQNLAGPDQEFFSDGLTEEMIAQLGRLDPQRLGVIARTSVMRYKGVEKGIEQVGQELRVDYVLEGSVRRAGNRVRITAQLIQVKDQTHLWAQSYERELGDILEVENDVARAIAAAIELELPPQQQARLACARPVSVGAYEAYLKGRYFWNQRTRGSFKKGLEYFQEAINQDPGDALAYVGLADSYNALGYFALLPRMEAYPGSLAAATKALAIDNTISEAHASLGNVRFWWEWDWRDAEREFKRTLELNPSYANAHQWYALYLVSMGQREEAIAEVKRAQELEPASPIINTTAARVNYLAGHYDATIEQCRKALDLDSNFAPARLHLGWAYEHAGKYEQALEQFQNARISDETPSVLGALGHGHAVAGRKAEAEDLLRESKQRCREGYFPAWEIALIHAGLGGKDQAFEWLEKAYIDRCPWLIHLNVEPRLNVLRFDLRFQDLLGRVGLPH